MNILAELPVEKAIRQSLRVSEGRSVKVSGRRYSVANLKIFAVHGCECVRCGRVGNRVIAWLDNGGSLHVDLFSKEDTKLILMNRDHIIPKSKKGSDHEWNLQPMCVKCNTKKGNKETETDKKASAFRLHWRGIHLRLQDSFWKVIPRMFRTKWATEVFVKFRERYLYRVSYVLAKVTA